MAWRCQFVYRAPVMLNDFNRVAAVILVLAAASGCGPGRTAAATQTTPAAFDPAASDAKAVALVDKMMTALGGYQTWVDAKQIRFDLSYSLDGQLKGMFKHAWDKWNGRHRFEHIDMSTIAKAQAEGNPGLVRSLVVMYDLFDRDKGFVTYGGKQVSANDRKVRIADAYQRWKDDTYKIAFPYKLKDPGVVLKYVSAIKDQNGTCLDGCDVVGVTFSDGVGKDSYEVWISQKTMLPEVMRKKMDQGWLGFAFKGWTEAGGLKFAGQLVNLGVKEVFAFSNIQVGEPDDSLYIPTVH